MMGTATMMLTQSQSRHRLVNDSLETSKIRNAADVAQVRIKNLFLNYPRLLLSSPDFWDVALLYPYYSTEARELVSLTRLCQSDREWRNTKNMLLEYARAEDIKIENNTFFQLMNITHPGNNQAIITIQAKNQRGTTANLQAKVRYEFHYLEQNVPSLWIATGNKMKSEFSGDVWINDCNFDKSRIRIANPQKDQVKYVGYEFPELPDLSKIINRIPKSHVITLDRNYDGETSFPRSQDSPTRVIQGYTIYEYVMDRFDTNQPIEFKTVVEGKPVMIIVNTKQGINKGEISHSCDSSSDCSAENLIFINHATNMNDKMCFVTDQLNAFIFSPHAGVGFAKKTAVNLPEISGSIWTKELVSDRICGDNIKLYQTLTFEKIIRDFQILSPYPKITEISEFKRVDETVIESESNSRIPIEPPPMFAESIPLFIDEEFNPYSP